jgi:hypothetical protein
MLHRWKFLMVGGVIRMSASKATLLILWLLEKYFFNSTIHGSVQYITKIVDVVMVIFKIGTGTYFTIQYLF